MNVLNKTSNASKVIRLYGRSIFSIWQANPSLTLLSIISVILTGLSVPIQVWISKILIDRTITLIEGSSADWQMLIPPLITFGIVWIFSQIFQSISASVHELMATTVRYDTLRKVTQKAASLDLAFFDTPTFYDQMNLAKNEAFRLENFTINLTQILPQVVTTLSLLILLARSSFLFPLILLITSLPKILLLGLFSRKQMDLRIKYSQEERMISYLAHLLGDRAAAKEIRLFQLQDHLLQRHQTFGRNYLRRLTMLTTSNEAGISVLTLLALLGTAGIWGYAGWMALSGMISLGDVALIFQAVERSRTALGQISTLGSQLAGDTLYLKALFGFLDLQPEDVDGSLRHIQAPIDQPGRSFEVEGCIEFRHVSFHYPHSDRLVLKDISFRTEKGQIGALVGENGAGKTTIVKLLTRLYDPTEGQILLDGRDIREYDLVEYHRLVGAVFQDFSRYDLTVHENIGFGNVEAIADREQVEEAARLGGADVVVAKLPQGYDTVLGKRFEGGVDLSGGEWQKLALSRAFIREASLFILDEPTSALDARGESEVYQRFAELTRGKTTLFVTHRLSSVRMAHQILVLKQGQLVEKGLHEELIARGNEYARMFKLQAERYR